MVLKRPRRPSSVRVFVVGGVIAPPHARCDDGAALHQADSTPRHPPAAAKSRVAALNAARACPVLARARVLRVRRGADAKPEIPLHGAGVNAGRTLTPYCPRRQGVHFRPSLTECSVMTPASGPGRGIVGNTVITGTRLPALHQ